MTGKAVANSQLLNSPVRWAYQYCLKTYETKPIANRNSWDQTAVLCAVRNPEDYFYVVGPGTLISNENGYNYWITDMKGKHQFLVHKYPYQEIAELMDELMMQ